MPPITPPEAATLDGHLERITYHNPENHYTVARVQADRQPRPITVVGYLPGVSPGQDLRLKGRWETHPRFGQQFKIEAFEIVLPATVAGIRHYLESGVVKGIGPKTARRLVAHFQAHTLEVIEKAPERLCEVAGIGPRTARQIAETWRAHHAARSLMQFLQENGLKPSYAGRLLQTYGAEAATILRENPFRVARELPGIGFPIADAISQNLGQPPDAPERLRACIHHLLEQQTSAGHLFMPRVDLLERCQAAFGIPPQAAAGALVEMAAQKAVVIEEDAAAGGECPVYLDHLHRAETDLARRLAARLSLPAPPLHLAPERVTAAVLKKLAIKLSDEQTQVLTAVLAQRAAIITGGPGTGKTTLIRSLTAVMEALGKRFLLAAPTGRAARRLGEVSGRPTATIHKLLGYNFSTQSFERDQDDPLETDALIVDEASMVDILLMHQLIKAVPMSAALILVGDVFQLPPVGPGNVLGDLIRSQRLPVHALNTIFRQARESPIVINAHRIRRGRMPAITPTESPVAPAQFCFLAENRPGPAVDVIVSLCRDILPARYGFDPIHDIQVLTPMHRGEVGTLHLNRVLQQALNPPVPNEKGAHPGLRPGDKVMHLRNDYQREVFNGDIGTVHSAESDGSRLSVDFYGRIVAYDRGALEDLSLAYAISVHKSQGSEYPAVVLPVMTQHYPLLQRNLIYTALTRAKTLVVLIGTPRAVAIAVQNDTPQKRLSRLAERLRV
jgi:exodeoxyribonuclease V alpha subunit